MRAATRAAAIPATLAVCMMTSCPRTVTAQTPAGPGDGAPAAQAAPDGPPAGQPPQSPEEQAQEGQAPEPLTNVAPESGQSRPEAAELPGAAAADGGGAGAAGGGGRAGDAADALVLFQRALELEKGPPCAQAMAALRKAHRLAPGEAAYAKALFWALARRQRHAEVADEGEEILANFPSDPQCAKICSVSAEALVALAAEHREASRWEDAAAALRRARRLDAAGPMAARAGEALVEADVHLVGVYERARRHVDAARTLAELAALRPSAPDAATRFEALAGPTLREESPGEFERAAQAQASAGRPEEARRLLILYRKVAHAPLTPAMNRLAARIARSGEPSGPASGAETGDEGDR